MPKPGLVDFLDAIGVERATGGTWSAVVEAGYDSLAAIRALDVPTLAAVRRSSGVTVGEVNAGVILASLNGPIIQPLLDRADFWLDETPRQVEETPSGVRVIVPLPYKKVVLTGSGPAPRNILMAAIKAAQAGQLLSGECLICDDPEPLKPSTKLKAARAKGVHILGYRHVFGSAE